jgi:hypothetical protein
MMLGAGSGSEFIVDRIPALCWCKRAKYVEAFTFGVVQTEPPRAFVRLSKRYRSFRLGYSPVQSNEFLPNFEPSRDR